MRIEVDRQNWEFFNDLKVGLKYASVGSTFSFKTYFEPENRKQRSFLRPLTYQRVKIFDDEDKLLLTGEIVNHNFKSSSTRELVNVSGYSLPGVLEDCTIPVELYPLQTDGKTLREIAEALINPFGINLFIDFGAEDQTNQKFEETTASETQTIKAYLDELASQKDIVLSHTVFGSLLLTKARANASPIAEFLGNNIPGVRMSLSTNGRSMHSAITVQQQADIDNDNAGQETINNPFVSRFRPTTKTQTSGDDIDTKKAVRNALSSELRSIVLTIKTDRWTWNAGGKQTMTPNHIITVHNHEIHLYNNTRFFVESVDLSGTPEAQEATLTCVIPEVYNGNIPRNIFTIPNLHD